MMRTINFKIISPDERLSSSLSVYRSMLQYALNYAINHQVKSFFKLNSILYRELRSIFKAPSRLAQDAMRQAIWIYRRWRKEKNSKRPIIKRKSMVLTPEQSLTFDWNKASILTFKGRVSANLNYVESYHGKYKDWVLREARLVNKDSSLWLKCIFSKDVPKVEVRDVMGIDLNFNNITIAFREGITKIDTDAMKVAIHHKKIIENIQKRYGKASRQKLLWVIKKHGKRMKDRAIDRLRKIAKAVVKPNHAVALENLKNIRARKNGFSKLHLWCYRKFQQAIINENEEYGNETIFVKARGTSSNCYKCNGKMKRLSYHKLSCPRCDYETDRDELASINIRMRGLQPALIAPERNENPNSMMGKLENVKHFPTGCSSNPF